MPAHDVVGADDRTGADPQPQATQLRHERRCGALHDASTLVAHLGGHDHVTRAQRRVEAAGNANDDHRLRRKFCKPRQPLPDLLGPHAAASQRRAGHPAGQRGVLGAQRGDNQQVVHGNLMTFCAVKYRPSALSGNTTRYIS